MRWTRSMILRLAGAGVGVAALALAAMPVVSAQSAMRAFSAEFNAFGFEFFTGAAPAAGGLGGLLIYSKSITVPSNSKTLVITVTATGDNHGSAVKYLSCNVDGVVCTAGGSGTTGAPSGWIASSNVGANDWHDNQETYTWCKALSSGAHTVNLRLASSATAGVFLESVYVYISGNKSACVAGTPLT
jgi:hypothetical protein